jgi:hypothetical protein
MYYGIINSMKKGGSSYTARTTAFATATGITDVTILGALNTFDLGLISNSLDTKMKAVYPFVGSTSTTQKYNFMDARDLNAAFRLSFNGGGTFSSNGYQPNGTNAFADTFLIPSSSLLLNSIHISAYVRNDLTSDAPVMSSEDVSYNKGLYIWPKTSSSIYSVRINDDTSQTGSVSVVKGLHIATRTASNVKKYRVNNTQMFNVTTAPSSLNTDSIYIAKSRNNANYFANQIAFISIGDGLTDGEATTFYNLVQNMQTTLSRQV